MLIPTTSIQTTWQLAPLSDCVGHFPEHSVSLKRSYKAFTPEKLFKLLYAVKNTQNTSDLNLSLLGQGP